MGAGRMGRGMAHAFAYAGHDVVLVDVEGFECRVLAGAAATLAGEADWAVEVHVGCGLEAAGGSVERVLASNGIDEITREAVAKDYLGQMILSQASMLAFRDTFLLVAIACLVALVPVAIMRGGGAK